mmetsp:Transcript_17451/g.33681  ORF Transcript_17451/g.33681 Transcript_17451/m.33681 type:complete len:450 (-) Transcript_17451:240-1589(-)
MGSGKHEKRKRQHGAEFLNCQDDIVSSKKPKKSKKIKTNLEDHACKIDQHEGCLSECNKAHKSSAFEHKRTVATLSLEAVDHQHVNNSPSGRETKKIKKKSKSSSTRKECSDEILQRAHAADDRGMEQDEEIIVEADPAPSHVRGSERNPPSTSTAELGSDHYVSLADRLNPNRKGFDAEFKAKWGEMSKPQKAAVVKKDKQTMAALKSRTARISYPFQANPDDHCETSADAYRDVVPVLDLLAGRLKKSREELQIYDPYYCAGAVKTHLLSLGFPNVYNECEDFYDKLKNPDKLPMHDVIITNPPYGEEHIRQLLRFCLSNNKPYLLLLPDYICGKDYYQPCFAPRGSTEVTNDMLPSYLVPANRYIYWTPHGLRDMKSKKSHRNLPLGIRTSPFASLWHVSTKPVISKKAFRYLWTEQQKKMQVAETSKVAKLYGALEELPIKLKQS